ncbi:c-type cytochrome [Caballeronia insecticola]|uniref:Cytochrome c class I n=1 Tax=Caballeronia insecticola TaxID=758793 RepID=R4WFH1_9BURK|nr:c-type cytochrome [Caballeronia insecticola]BAN22393.1 cytochrome c class I [Caballeronia insecticola]
MNAKREGFVAGIAGIAGIALLAVLGTAHAQGNDMSMSTSMQGFAQSHNCMSCHSVSRTFMGPSFDSVAHRYAQVDGARATLARRIVEGGVGVWGPVPMPANTQISSDQAVALADWILSLR